MTCTVSPVAGRRFGELHGLDRRLAELPGVVADHREVVQRMHVLDHAIHLDRAREGQAHVAERDRHRVAVDGDQPAHRVEHDAGAVVVALGDARNRSTAC